MTWGSTSFYVLYRGIYSAPQQAIELLHHPKHIIKESAINPITPESADGKEFI